MRLNKITLLIGRRGCGKTTFYLNMSKLDRKKIIVVDLFAHPDYTTKFQDISMDEVSRWKSGNVRLYGGEPVAMLTNVFQNCSNCTLVMEDCKRYIDPVVQKPIRQGIIEHRNRNIDIVMMFHTLKDVPPYVCSMHNDIILFKTNENVDRVRQDKFSNWDQLAEAHHRIMNHKSPFYNEVVNLQ